jgi:hypothetical protein
MASPFANPARLCTRLCRRHATVPQDTAGSRRRRQRRPPRGELWMGTQVGAGGWARLRGGIGRVCAAASACSLICNYAYQLNTMMLLSIMIDMMSVCALLFLQRFANRLDYRLHAPTNGNDSRTILGNTCWPTRKPRSNYPPRVPTRPPPRPPPRGLAWGCP